MRSFPLTARLVLMSVSERQVAGVNYSSRWPISGQRLEYQTEQNEMSLPVGTAGTGLGEPQDG